jgi:uncharacterized coiled-coil protein SlyX
MISELKDDEILEFLMTSDFEDDYSPTELKYLLVKWRYFYRLKQGNLERKTVDFEGQIQMLEDKIKAQEKEKINLQTQLADKQNVIDSMKNRNLTLKERWSGKIILKENEN